MEGIGGGGFIYATIPTFYVLTEGPGFDTTKDDSLTASVV
jgi:hypothetical protein